MRRIFFVARCFNETINTGSGRSVADAAFGLAELGWEVHLVAGRQGYQKYKNSKKNKIISSVLIHRLWGIDVSHTSSLNRIINFIFFYFACAITLLRLVKRDDIVVATTDPPLISFIVHLVTRIKKAVLINWLLDIYPEVAAALGVKVIQGWRLKLLRNLCNISWRAARYNIVLGSRMADFVQRICAVRDSTIIQPNWEDGNLVKPYLLKSENHLTKEWEFENKFVLGYFGNFGRAYEFSTIIQAAKILQNFSDKIVFLLVGDGFFINYIKKSIAEFSLQNIILKPYVPRERISESLGVADVHLITMRANVEGLLVPGKLYTALAAQRPIIFVGDAENGEVGQTLKNHCCGMSVQLGDDKALVTAIMQYFDNPHLAREHGHNARKAFEKHYEKSIAIRRWDELLKTID